MSGFTLDSLDYNYYLTFQENNNNNNINDNIIFCIPTIMSPPPPAPSTLEYPPNTGVMRMPIPQYYLYLSHDGYYHEIPQPKKAVTTMTGELIEQNASQVREFGQPVYSRTWNYTVPTIHDFPCVPAEHDWDQLRVMKEPLTETDNSGFFFSKSVKVGGSTAASVHLRIARNVARRLMDMSTTTTANTTKTTKKQSKRNKPLRKGATNSTLSSSSSSILPMCKTRNEHGLSSTLKYHLRDKSNSFLWAILRNPTKRAISEFYHFHVSRAKVEPTDSNFKVFLNEHKGTNNFRQLYYLRALTVRRPMSRIPRDLITFANEIIDDFDFIGITERMDESMVVLKYLLNLTIGDILHIDSKTNGAFDDGQSKNGCTYIVPSYVSDGMKEYFKGDRWHFLALADTYLHQAANKSLSRTITEVIGQEEFDRDLQLYRYAQQRLHESSCVQGLKLLCDSSGNKRKTFATDCMYYDCGCGMDCADEIANELGIA